MLSVAVRSAAFHRASLLATGIVIMVGTFLVGTMAAVLATGLASTTFDADRDFLTQFPVILGSWILGIVLFAVVSTVSVSLGSRTTEIVGLRLVGAEPAQIRSMVAIECLATAVIAAVPGVALSYLGGMVVVGRVTDAGLVHSESPYAPGISLPILAGVLVVAASAIGGFVGAKRIAEQPPVHTPADFREGDRSARGRRRRQSASAILIVAGLASSLASLGMSADSVYATAATGPGCVLVAVGLSLLAPEVLASVISVLRRLPRTRSSSAHLARINLAAAPDRARPAVTFVSLFVGVAAGTLSMQSIENRVNRSPDDIGSVMASINYAVVALIGVFMAIALVNNMLNALRRRRPEFRTMTSVGATSATIRRMLEIETFTAVFAASLVASLGAALVVVPFALVKTGDAVDAIAPIPYLIPVTVAAVLTFAIVQVGGRTRVVTSR